MTTFCCLGVFCAEASHCTYFAREVISLHKQNINWPLGGETSKKRELWHDAHALLVCIIKHVNLLSIRH